ncbi:MAG TPA: Crp/Fnr family transcriptional regulator [Bacteroidia bacterium]|nr:Crp/Fnr family transcriptional regulator [Bacteroidia bacterium]
MVEVFKEYLKSKISFTDEKFKAISTLLIPKSVTKGTSLLSEGEVCQYNMFVIKGCLRSYVIDKNGKEHIIQFAPENWWISEQNSLLRQEPAIFFIDAVEDTQMLLMEKNFNEKLTEILPDGGRMLQLLFQNSFKAMQKRVVNLLSASAEERYIDFIKTYPTVALRVPQKMIASYLGITPESLSRIRKEVAHQ